MKTLQESAVAIKFMNGRWEEKIVPMSEISSFYRSNGTFEPSKVIFEDGTSSFCTGFYSSIDEAHELGYFDLTSIHFLSGTLIWRRS